MLDLLFFESNILGGTQMYWEVHKNVGSKKMLASTNVRFKKKIGFKKALGSNKNVYTNVGSKTMLGPTFLKIYCVYIMISE